MRKILVFIGIVFLFSCNDNDGHVIYKVELNKYAYTIITYLNAHGDVQQDTISDTEWTTSFYGHRKDDVYVSAIVDDTLKNVVVTVSIEYNDSPFATKKDSDDYVVYVEVSGILD